MPRRSTRKRTIPTPSRTEISDENQSSIRNNVAGNSINDNQVRNNENSIAINYSQNPSTIERINSEDMTDVSGLSNSMRNNNDRNNLTIGIRHPLINNHEIESFAEIRDSDAGCSFQSIKGNDITVLKALIDVIPPFTGQDGSFQIFSKECKFAEQSINPALRPLFARFLRSKIQGDAQIYIRNFHFSSVEELLSILEKAFGISKSLFQIQSEIAHIKQMKNETILSYGARVMNLFNKIVEITKQQSPAHVAEIKIKEYNLEVATCFRLGLEGELETRVRQENPYTLNDAINIAIQAEKDLSRRKRLRAETNNEIYLPDRNMCPTSGSNNSNKNLKPCYQIKNQFQKPLNNLTCYTCGENGHTSRNCAKRNTNPVPNAHKFKNKDFQNSNFNNKRIKTECTYCNLGGHTFETCYKRRAEEAEKALENYKKTPSTSNYLNLTNARRPGATTSRDSNNLHQSAGQSLQSQNKQTRNSS